MVEHHDVIIAGAGPVGLTLALGLVRRGVDVVVLEKESGTAEHSRAPAIWPATQEILGKLGVVDRFLAGGIALPALELWDVDRERQLLRLPVEELAGETTHPRLLIVPQSRTERLLHAAISEVSGDAVRFSSEVVGLEQTAAGVQVRYRTPDGERAVHGRFVAGCDGAGSKVRELIGGSLEGMTYAMRAALADTRLPELDELRFPRLTTRPALAIGIRIDRGIWRLILPFGGENAKQTLDERIADAARSLFGVTDYELVWKSEFRLHRRMSSRWVDGRIVLAGDAAHLNSPVGGEGMNAGIMDAAALTDALTNAVTSGDTSLLIDYASRRRSMIEGGVNPFTDRMTQVLLAWNGRLIRPALRAASVMLKIKPLRLRLLRRMALLDQR